MFMLLVPHFASKAAKKKASIIHNFLKSLIFYELLTIYKKLKQSFHLIAH